MKAVIDVDKFLEFELAERIFASREGAHVTSVDAIASTHQTT